MFNRSGELTKFPKNNNQSQNFSLYQTQPFEYGTIKKPTEKKDMSITEFINKKDSEISLLSKLLKEKEEEINDLYVLLKKEMNANAEKDAEIKRLMEGQTEPLSSKLDKMRELKKKLNF